MHPSARPGYLHGYRLEGCEHIVPVDEGEEALRRGHDGLELEVVRTEDQPPSEHIPSRHLLNTIQWMYITCRTKMSRSHAMRKVNIKQP